MPADPAPPTDLLDPYAARPPAPLAWRDRLAAIGDLTPGRVAAAAAVGVLVLAVAAVLLLRRPAPPPELSLPMASSTTAAPTTEPAPTEVVAHAAGAVAHPGIYRLAPGARVADLVDAAGGLTDGADGDRVNLAAPLTDGAQVYVPEEGEPAPVVAPPPGPGGPSSTDPAAQPVDLNEATAADLDTLPGVGPATAQAILDWRAANGAFTSVDQLLDVRGIGEAKLAELRSLVTV